MCRSLRVFPAVVFGVALVVGCGAPSVSVSDSSPVVTAQASEPSRADTSVPDTSVPDTSAPEDFAPEDSAPNTTVPPSADQIDIDRPITNEPGVSSLAVLTKAEVCSLVPDDEAKTIWGFSTALTLKGWTQTDSSSSCSHIFNDEPTQGGTPNVVWELTRQSQSAWPEADAEYKRTVKDVTVGTRPARVVASEPSDLGSNDIDVFIAVDESVSLQVSVYGDDSVFDETKLLAQAERILSRVSSLTPTVEPARDAQVKNVFDLTGGQLCALLRDNTAAALLSDNRPSGISSYLVTRDSLSCSIGSAKLGVAVLSAEPFSIDEATKSPAKVGSLAGVWDKPSLEGGKAAPGAEVQYVSLLVKWREVWLQVQARLVLNTPEVERLVIDEMTHLLAQLDAIVR
jgi:hypothetical protein